jgi:hypothetical protein
VASPETFGYTLIGHPVVKLKRGFNVLDMFLGWSVTKSAYRILVTKPLGKQPLENRDGG